MWVGAGVPALARRLAEMADGATQKRPLPLETSLLHERRLGGCEGIGDLHARATLVARRCDQLSEQAARHVVSERGVSSLGGARRPVCVDTQVVDDTDEWPGAYGGTNREDPDTHEPPLGDCNDNRCGRNEEQVAKAIRVVARCLAVGRSGRKHAHGGVDIGQAGAADGYLHSEPLGSARS
jgi:hypothetical protein